MPSHDLSRPTLPLRLLLPVLMLTQTFGWGVNLTLLGVIAAPAGVELGLAPPLVYSGATALFLSAAAAGPAVGRAVDRIGGAQVLAIGTVVPAVALALLAFSQGIATWLLAWGLQGVATHVALATAAYGTLAQQAGSGSRRAIGTLTIATGLCATIMWPVSNLLMDAMGWRMMCLVYAGATLFLVLPANLWILFRCPRHRPAAPDASDPGLPPETAARAYRLVALFQAIGLVVGTTLMVMMIDIFTALGTPRGEAIFAASLVGVAYVVSRGIEVALGSRLTPVALSIAVLTAMAVSLTPLVLWPLTGAPLPFWLAAATAVLYGLPAGLLGILRPTIPQQVFGVAAYGRYLGRLARPGDLANAGAPAIFAALLDVSAAATVLLSVLLCFVGLAAMCRLHAVVSERVSRPA